MSTGGASGEAITIRNCWVVSELPPHPIVQTIPRHSASIPAHLPTVLLRCKLLFIRNWEILKIGCGTYLRTMCRAADFHVEAYMTMVQFGARVKFTVIWVSTSTACPFSK